MFPRGEPGWLVVLATLLPPGQAGLDLCWSLQAGLVDSSLGGAIRARPRKGEEEERKT